MKSKLIILALFAFGFILKPSEVSAQFPVYEPLPILSNGAVSRIVSSGIVTERSSGAKDEFMVYKPIPLVSNGLYEASVQYYNHSTYQRSTYTLDVKLDQDNVVAIYFPDGGSIHVGQNNQGYRFSGGGISYKLNSQGKIIGGTTRITLSDGNGTKTFDITL